MKHLTTLLLTLLVLSSCSSELDRCIEANTGNLENNNEEKFQKFMDEHRDKDGRINEGWSDAYDDFKANVLTDFEREIGVCVADKIAAYMEENKPDLSVSSEAREFNAKSEEIWVSCEKSLSLERVEKATKICNAQGIY